MLCKYVIIFICVIAAMNDEFKKVFRMIASLLCMNIADDLGNDFCLFLILYLQTYEVMPPVLYGADCKFHCLL